MCGISEDRCFSVEPGPITIDYPAEGSVFPPEFPAPTWLWRDAEDKATSWEINIAFSDGSPAIRAVSAGERMRIGRERSALRFSDQRAPGADAEAGSGSYLDAGRRHVGRHQRSIRLAARQPLSSPDSREGDSKTIVSRGQVSIQTSSDPVGAPIFYRDVPLMPSENEKGVIKPLALTAVPLIAWRLRSVGDKESRVVMEGLHTCANCHSFSADGKTLGLDMDGPQNDKGLYAIVKVKPHMTIRNEDLVAWSTSRGKLRSKLRVGFMSQDLARRPVRDHLVNDPGIDQTDYQRRKNPKDLVRNYYVANFKDYRFLQVFYPTRGVLAWYSRKSAHLQYLPGADDTRYVHANAVWSPDGKYLVFARAQARDAYPDGANSGTICQRSERDADSSSTSIASRSMKEKAAVPSRSPAPHRTG